MSLSLIPGHPAAAGDLDRGVDRQQAVDSGVSSYLGRIRGDRVARDRFFRELPKGADLHNHLSGAATTELLIQLAAQDGMCIDRISFTAVKGPCDPSKNRPASDAESDPVFRRQVIRAWSMQGFRPGAESGHDHFFNTFAKFGAVSGAHPGRLLAQVANGAARQHQFYLEVMLTPNSGGAATLAAKVGYNHDFSRMLGELQANGQMDQVVQQARTEANALEAEFRAAAHCGTATPDPGCFLPIRFISQVSRGNAPERVFTQMVLGMELAERDPRFVAVNLVQPEDNPVAVRDYTLHMQMLDFLHRRYPRAHITLHAGELVAGLVKPEDLRFHIRQAVRIGQAERIGHGVDVRHEDHAEELLRQMAARHILVEILLTSNAQILNVTGYEHPFPLYRRFHVPVALATDDEGVERTDITHEYERAALTYRLEYRDLKDLARASLEYAFLPGRSLWRSRDGYRPVRQCADDRPDSGRTSAACERFLSSNEKAAVEWKQERAFARFERNVLRRAAPVPAHRARTLGTRTPARSTGDPTAP